MRYDDFNGVNEMKAVMRKIRDQETRSLAEQHNRAVSDIVKSIKADEAFPKALSDYDKLKRELDTDPHGFEYRRILRPWAINFLKQSKKPVTERNIEKALEIRRKAEHERIMRWKKPRNCERKP